MLTGWCPWRAEGAEEKMAVGDSRGFSTFGLDERSRRIGFKNWDGNDKDKIEIEAPVKREDLSPEEALIRREEEQQEKEDRERGLKLLPGRLLEIAENKFSLRKSDFKGLDRSLYWGYRSYFFRHLLWMVERCRIENAIEKRELCEIFSLISRKLPHWKVFTPRYLADLIIGMGKAFPNGRRGIEHPLC